MSPSLSPTDTVAFAAMYVGRQQNLLFQELTDFVHAELLEYASLGTVEEQDSFLKVSEEIVTAHWFEIAYE